MTHTLKTSLAAGFVALTMAVAAPMVMAGDTQPRRGERPGIGGPMRGGAMGAGREYRRLDLSDDQKAQIKTIAESHQAEFKAVRDKVRAAREGLRTLLQAETLDEAAVRAKSVEVAAAEADVAILGAKVRAQTQQVLTAEQLQQLKDQRAKRESRMKERRPHR
jgi:protein CpxP